MMTGIMKVFAVLTLLNPISYPKWNVRCSIGPSYKTNNQGAKSKGQDL